MNGLCIMFLEGMLVRGDNLLVMKLGFESMFYKFYISWGDSEILREESFF